MLYNFSVLMKTEKIHCHIWLDHLNMRFGKMLSHFVYLLLDHSSFLFPYFKNISHELTNKIVDQNNRRTKVYLGQ